MIFKIQHILRLICVLFTGTQLVCACLYAEVPTFINDSIYASNKANVVTVDSNSDADLVILDGGLEQGLRLGMTCLVERDRQHIGELIIVESKSNCSVALILNLTDNLIIQSGDHVRIKTFRNS